MNPRTYIIKLVEQSLLSLCCIVLLYISPGPHGCGWAAYQTSWWWKGKVELMHLLFSSPEHRVFRLSYCDPSLSAVRRASTFFLKHLWNGVRTFVPTDIRSHAIFDRAGHSCSHQMTTPDIRAHIKWPPGHSCSHQITTLDIRKLDLPVGSQVDIEYIILYIYVKWHLLNHYQINKITQECSFSGSLSKNILNDSGQLKK